MARTGEEYTKSLNDGRELYVDGNLVRDVTSYRPFQGMISTIADLYDQQNEAEYHDALTFPSPVTGSPVNLSYMVPTTEEEFYARVRCERIRVERTYGMLGRLPDFVASLVTAWTMFPSMPNAKAVHAYVRDNDVCMTHVLIDPQIDRSEAGRKSVAKEAVRIVEENDSGLVLRGARMLSTLAPVANEIMIGTGAPRRPEEADFCVLGVVPASAPGLKIFAREPYDDGRGHFDRPLSSRFDEGDALVVFDDVLLPWDRVASYRDVMTYNRSLSAAVPVTQVLVRPVVKLRFLIGVSCLVANSIGRASLPRYQEMIGELVSTLEVAEAVLAGALHNWWLELQYKQRVMAGEADPATAPVPVNFVAIQNAFFRQAFAQVNDCVRLLGSSGLIMAPSEKDFANGAEIGALNEYLRGSDTPANRRVATMKLAWDTFGSQFGSRQELYEWYFTGHPIDGNTRTYMWPRRAECEAYAQGFLDRVVEEQESAGR